MGKPAIPTEIRQKITDLRQTGHSIPEIHRLLNVPKSTCSRYCRKVEILPEFKSRWLERKNASKIISEKAWKIAQDLSANLISDLSHKELKILGAALYWAEGAKRQFNFINSDPDMIRLFIYILINAYGVSIDSIKISLRLFEDISIPDAIKFWSKTTGIELNNKIELNIIKGSKKGKLPYGMCRIRVKKGGLLLKTMFAINKRVMTIIPPRSSTDRAVAS